MSTVFDTAADAEYFRLRPWIENATRQMTCTAEDCEYGGMIDPRQEIIRDGDRGAAHVDCVIAQMED